MPIELTDTDLDALIERLAEPYPPAPMALCNEAAAALAELRDRIADLEAGMNAQATAGKSLYAATELLIAERDALKQDAARYRWLRDADHERIIFAAHYERSSAASSTVDAAIDAARETP